MRKARMWLSRVVSQVAIHWYFFKDQRKWMIRFTALQGLNILCVYFRLRDPLVVHTLWFIRSFIILSSFVDHASWAIVKTISLYSPRFFSAIAWICVVRCSARHRDFIAHKSPHIFLSPHISLIFPVFRRVRLLCFSKESRAVPREMKTSRWVNRSKRIGNKW